MKSASEPSFRLKHGRATRLPGGQPGTTGRVGRAQVCEVLVGKVTKVLPHRIDCCATNVFQITNSCAARSRAESA